MLVKQYYETLSRYTHLKSREALVSLLQQDNLEMILPLVLKTDDSRAKFSAFLKIAFNEGKKNKNATSKTFVSLLKNTLQILTKRGKEGDIVCADFIASFYLDEVVSNGFKALQETQTSADGKKSPIVKDMCFASEEHSAKFACPSMFYFMTKFFMKENKALFNHTHAVLSDVLTLSMAYSFQLAAFSTSLKERFTKLALEVVYFAHDNLRDLDIASLENVVNNRLALHTAQSLKNEKKNDKN